MKTLALLTLLPALALGADTKISALTAAGAAAAANELPINEAGTSKKVTAAQMKTFINTANVFAAGSASAASWPVFTAGTVMTTAEEGAVELDADVFYLTTDAANRGVVMAYQFIRADSARTLGNVGTEQAIFNSPTNGRLTVETGLYRFNMLLYITAMSATSGNAAIDPDGAGTATTAAYVWDCTGIDATTPTTVAARNGAPVITQQTAASAVTAGTGTAMFVRCDGTFEVTGAGTIIPSITLVTAVATASVNIGSYFEIWRVGSTTAVSVGQWD